MPIQIGGLVSGLDTQNIIKDLLKGQQTRVDREFQKRQILEWQREDFREINTRLLNLKNCLFDMKISSAYTGKSVSSSSSDYLTATASSEAIPGTYSLWVQQTASRAALSSQQALGSGGDKSKLSTQFGIPAGTAINFSIEGKGGVMCFSGQAENVSMNDVVQAINKSNIGLQAVYDQGVDRFFLMASDYGKAGTIRVKVDGAGDGKGFLQDYLKLDLDYCSPNDPDGKPERVVGSSTAIVIAGSSPAQFAKTSSTLAELYNNTETVPATMNFTLEGSRGSYTFSVDKTAAIGDLLAAINAQTANTGIAADYSESDGLLVLYNNMAPSATLKTGSTANSAAISFNEALSQDPSGAPLLADGTDISTDFEYLPAAGSGAGLADATYHSGISATVDFTISGTPEVGDKIRAKVSTFYNAAGAVYQPQEMTWDGQAWVLEETDCTVAIRADDQNLLAKKLHLDADSEPGQNAIVDFNGSPGIEFESNQFTLNNINFNLNSITPVGTQINITVENDIDGAVDKIKAFVENYNTLLEQLNTKLGEKRYRDYKNKNDDYPPLTEEQKEQMTDEQIKKWEEKARSGLLSNDALLRSVLSELRLQTSTILTDVVPQKLSADQEVYIDDNNDLISCRSIDPDTGLEVLTTQMAYRSLESIGITTSQYSQKSADNGKLIIDEDKLRQSLEIDPDGVMKLFTLVQTEVEVDNKGDVVRTTDHNVGLAMRLYENLDKSIRQVTTKAGVPNSLVDASLLSQDIARVDQHINLLLDRMETQEQRYWRQFTAMERALQKITEQGNWLMQKLSQMQGSQQ